MVVVFTIYHSEVVNRQYRQVAFRRAGELLSGFVTTTLICDPKTIHTNTSLPLYGVSTRRRRSREGNRGVKAQ